MPVAQGDLSLLDEPVAQELLASTTPARLAYNWIDGTPRVVPIWFHWTGEEIVVVSPSNAPKLRVLAQNPEVALTIDRSEWPYQVLLIRGKARLEAVDGVAEEYVLAARRYFGEEGGNEWVANVRQMGATTVRIAVRPEWVGLLDFERRFPSAIHDAIMSAAV